MLEEKTKKTMYGSNTWFQDKESGHQYRRVACGVAFPYSAMPGFAVVLGEDLQADYSIPQSQHHIHLLAEFEHTEIEPLYRACLRFRDEFCVKSFYGNPEMSLYALWKKINTQESTVSISPQHEGLDVNMSLQLIKRYTGHGHKILHFGPNSLLSKDLVSIVPDELIKTELDECPTIAALGRALAEIGLNAYSSGVYKPTRRSRPRRLR